VSGPSQENKLISIAFPEWTLGKSAITLSNAGRQVAAATMPLTRAEQMRAMRSCKRAPRRRTHGASKR
jgi:hypothetical protein